MSAMTERINALTLDIIRQQERWDRHVNHLEDVRGPEAMSIWDLMHGAIGGHLAKLRDELRALAYRRSL